MERSTIKRWEKSNQTWSDHSFAFKVLSLDARTSNLACKLRYMHVMPAVWKFTKWSIPRFSLQKLNVQVWDVSRTRLMDSWSCKWNRASSWAIKRSESRNHQTKYQPVTSPEWLKLLLEGTLRGSVLLVILSMWLVSTYHSFSKDSRPVIDFITNHILMLFRLRRISRISRSLCFLMKWWKKLTTSDKI